MTQAQTFTGTGEELQSILSRHLNEKNMMLIIQADEAIRKPQAKLTPQQFAAALAELQEMNRDLPALPDEAFDRENIY